jgi:DNA-directed RNA polymerase specialized sigma24 family protein
MHGTSQRTLLMAKLSSPGGQSGFPSIRWSQVVATADLPTPDDRSPLEELCSIYWYPIYVFVRRKGNDAQNSAALTQSYFARLLKTGVRAAADPRKGRFRVFLRTDCENFLVDQHGRDQALMRGGAGTLISIDVMKDAEARYRLEPSDAMTPDRLFDRARATTLFGRVLDLLAAERAESGRAELFAHLRVVLTEGAGVASTAELAKRLGKTEGAFHVAVHRLRKRYWTILKEQIAATVEDPGQIDDEIRDLFEAMRK